MRFSALRLDVVRGPDFRLDGGAMFGVVPKVLWEKKLPADERNRVSLATNCLLVRGAGFVALIESGLGREMGREGSRPLRDRRPDLDREQPGEARRAAGRLRRARSLPFPLRPRGRRDALRGVTGQELLVVSGTPSASASKDNAQKLPTGQLDGIVRTSDGSLLISSWEGSSILR